MSETSDSQPLAAAEFFSDPNVLKSFLNSISDIVFLLDHNGCYLKIVTDKKGLLIGHEKDLLGKPFAEILPPEVAARCMGVLNKALNTGKCQCIEYNLDVPDGTKWFDCRVIPIKTQQDQPQTVLWIAKDSSDEKNIKKAIAQQEREKNLILNSIPDILAYLSTNRKILWANQTSRSILSPHMQTTGQYCYEIWFDRSAPCSNCPIPKIIETRKKQTIQITLKNDTTWLMTMTPVFDREGNIEGILEHGQDITRSIASAKMLAKSNKHLQLALQAANETAWEWEIGKPMEVTEECAKILGYNQNEYPRTEEEFLKLIHPSDKSYVAQKLLQVKNKEIESFVLQYRIKRKDGFWAWLHTTGVVVNSTDPNQAMRMIGINRDITEQKKMRDTLLQSRTDAEFLISELESEARQNTQKIIQSQLADTARSNLISYTRCELKTELATLSETLAKLASQPLPEHLQKYLSDMEQSKNILTGLVNSMTDQYQGKPAPVPIHFSLHDFLEEYIASNPLSKTGLILEPSQNLPESIKTDRNKLSRILTMLTKTLHQPTSSKSISIQILTQDNDRLLFRVKDNSTTIDQKQYSNIQREMLMPGALPQDASEDFCGLMMAKTLTQTLGGELIYKTFSSNAHGFEFSIPFFLPDHTDKANEACSALPNLSLAEVKKPEQHLILIAQESTNSILLTKTILKNLNYRTLSATNSERVLEIMRNVNLDAILIDVSPSQIKCFETVQAIRKIETEKNRPPVPIIGITSDETDDEAKLWANSKINGFILKPVSKQQIKKILEDLL